MTILETSSYSRKDVENRCQEVPLSINADEVTNKYRLLNKQIKKRKSVNKIL